DTFGATNADTMKVKVNNVAPTPLMAGPDTQLEGSLVSMSGNDTDPGVLDIDTYLWHVVASNGQTIADGTGSTFNFTPNDNGTYVVTFTATDNDGGAGSISHTVYVSNVAPIASSNAAKTTKQYSDFITSIQLSATDPSTADILTA